ncbi:MAG: queuosine precursor transporter [Kiloniellales bacterium]|nr:queuosine precursor transporter [Kiloniellales bacterium]
MSNEDSGRRVTRGVFIGVAAMTVIVAASNFLVQFPINDWLTWGALIYPIAFLVTDLTNRSLGPGPARRVIYVGFALAVLLSAVLATPRIALASGSAFLVAQLLDVSIFNYLRGRVWWLPPLVSSTIGSTVDTFIFFGLAFAGTSVPWITLAIGDLGVKLVLALLMLIPFRAFMTIIPKSLPSRSAQ